MNYSLYFLMLIMVVTSTQLHSENRYTPPHTEKRPVIDTVHGFVMTDPYRWLENKDNDEVKTWSHAQHNATVNFLKTKCPEVAGLKDEIRSYIDRDYRGAPFFKADREFFYAKNKGDQQSKIYTKIKDKEILIFDPLKIDPSGKTSIAGFHLTRDGNKAAVGVQFRGDEIDEYRIIDTRNGKVLGETIKNLSDFEWTHDEKHAYVTIRTKDMIKNQIPLKTFLHKIGDDQANDKFLLAPEDAKEDAGIWDTEEGGLTFMTVGDFYSNTLKVKKTGTDDDFVQIYSSKKYKADVDVRNNKIFIMIFIPIRIFFIRMIF